MLATSTGFRRSNPGSPPPSVQSQEGYENFLSVNSALRKKKIVTVPASQGWGGG